MASADLIGLWASGVWLDLGSPPNVSALTISGYAVQPSTLGTLNNFLSTCFSGSGYSGPGTVNYDVVPDIGANELAIEEQLYLSSYYNSLVQANMGYGGDSIPWTNSRDGDSSISRVSAAQIGSIYLKAGQDARNRLNYLVTAYLNSLGQNSPRQVLLPGLTPPVWSNAGWGLG